MTGITVSRLAPGTTFGFHQLGDILLPPKQQAAIAASFTEFQRQQLMLFLAANVKDNVVDLAKLRTLVSEFSWPKNGPVCGGTIEKKPGHIQIGLGFSTFGHKRVAGTYVGDVYIDQFPRSNAPQLLKIEEDDNEVLEKLLREKNTIDLTAGERPGTYYDFRLNENGSNLQVIVNSGGMIDDKLAFAENPLIENVLRQLLAEAGIDLQSLLDSGAAKISFDYHVEDDQMNHFMPTVVVRGKAILNTFEEKTSRFVTHRLIVPATKSGVERLGSEFFYHQGKRYVVWKVLPKLLELDLAC